MSCNSITNVLLYKCSYQKNVIIIIIIIIIIVVVVVIIIGPCGDGLKYLHIALRVVEGDEKGTQCLGV
jgi:hypothetical protein